MSDTGQSKEYKEPGTQGGGPKPKHDYQQDLQEELSKWEAEGISPLMVQVNHFVIDCRLAALCTYLVEKGLIDLEEFQQADAKFMVEVLQNNRPQAMAVKQQAMQQKLLPQGQELPKLFGPNGRPLQD